MNGTTEERRLPGLVESVDVGFGGEEPLLTDHEFEYHYDTGHKALCPVSLVVPGPAGGAAAKICVSTCASAHVGSTANRCC